MYPTAIYGGGVFLFTSIESAIALYRQQYSLVEGTIAGMMTMPVIGYMMGMALVGANPTGARGTRNLAIISSVGVALGCTIGAVEQFVRNHPTFTDET